MRKLLSLLLLAGLALLSPSPGYSQATLTSTTLSAAATVGATTISVASATGVVVGDLAFVDKEAMIVTAISGTDLTVRRGAGGVQAAHPNASKIYIDPPDFFILGERSGTCTRATVFPLVLPQINTNDGRAYDCINSVWVEVNTGLYAVRNVISGLGATRTLLSSESGSIVMLDRAAGITVTLPAPVVGLEYTFLASVSVTSNAYKFSTATQGTDFIVGDYLSIDTDTASAAVGFPCNGTTHDNFSMNGTTTGGLQGTRLKLTAVSTTLWLIEGENEGNGIVATACATS